MQIKLKRFYEHLLKGQKIYFVLNFKKKRIWGEKKTKRKTWCSTRFNRWKMRCTLKESENGKTQNFWLLQVQSDKRQKPPAAADKHDRCCYQQTAVTFWTGYKPFSLWQLKDNSFLASSWSKMYSLAPQIIMDDKLDTTTVLFLIFPIVLGLC